MTEKILRKEILAKNISKNGVDDNCCLKMDKAPLRLQYSKSQAIGDNRTRKAQGMQDPVSPRLLTLKQAAAYLGHSVHTLREMTYAHEIPTIQRGNRSKLWIDRHDLDRWIDEQKGMA